MSILNILIYPDNKLRINAKPVKIIDKNIKSIINDMFETMYFYKGIGLSATQVNIHKQIIIIDINNDKKNKIVIINPKIIKKEKFIKYKEGCLSIPNFFHDIIRYKNIIVNGLNEYGENISINAKNLLSTCIQHEIDHLYGILFIDYLSNRNVYKK